VGFAFPACVLLDSDKKEEEEHVLAVVNDKKLYAETLSDMDLNAKTKEDSLRFLEIYVNRWIRDQLLIQEAKKKTENNPRIKELVEEYRNSLLLHEYEQQIIQDHLDSSVDRESMKTHYEAKKESYILNDHIYRVKWIYTNSSNINLDSVRVFWNRNDSTKNEALTSLAELYAKSFNLNPDLWWKEEELRNILQITDEEWEKVEEGVTILFERQDANLILNVIEEKEKGEYAPLSYVDDNIRRYILHQRKEEILKDVRNDLYRSAVENNTIKINIQ
jgi:hypothetical protein